MVEQCPSAVSGSVGQPDPKAMQHHIEKAAVTSGRGQGKISGERIMYAEVAWYCTSIIKHTGVQHSFIVFLLAALYENMKSNRDPPVITLVY